MPDRRAYPFDAVVFDLDGSLVNTEQASKASLAAVLAEEGHRLTDEEYAWTVGRAWPDVKTYLCDLMGWNDDGLAAYLERWDAAFEERHAAVDVFPDAAAVLSALADVPVRLAVCTSSGQRHLDHILDGQNLQEAFDSTVVQQDTTEHKPLPAPYLLSAERLGLHPSQCVAIEDSTNGALSARAAGMAVVGVDRGFDMDLSAAHVVVDQLDVDALTSAHRRLNQPPRS